MDFPEEPKAQPFVEETLDHEPLKFGKFKGKTASWVAEHGEKGDSYLVWAYENVGGFDVCSHTLYKDCGGTGTKAARAQPQNEYQRRNRKDLRHATTDPQTGEIADDDSGRYSSRQSSPAARHRPASSFDDMDDDIPF